MKWKQQANVNALSVLQFESEWPTSTKYRLDQLILDQQTYGLYTLYHPIKDEEYVGHVLLRIIKINVDYARLIFNELFLVL